VTDQVQTTISVDDPAKIPRLLGAHDESLKIIEREVHVRVVVRGDSLDIRGRPVDVQKGAQVLKGLLDALGDGRSLTRSEVEYATRMAYKGDEEALAALKGEPIFRSHTGKFVRPRTPGQMAYLRAMQRSDLVFAIGPAGTGKTYLAVAVALAWLREKRVSRLVLTRPAVEAGERLGFLPGDMREKVNPYLRPLTDALYEMLGIERTERLGERGVLEIAPLAYMRGRTLNDAFIILDEGQNTTPEQMKMFLTRTGFGSKVVVTGDITQIDLPEGRVSGLVDVQGFLMGLPGIEFAYLTDADVVRHRIVQDIIQAYAKRDTERSRRESECT